MTLASGAFFIGKKAVIPFVPLDMMAFSLCWIGQAKEGQTMDFTSSPAVLNTGEREILIPVNLLVGRGREAVKAEIAAQVDRLFDAVEGKKATPGPLEVKVAEGDKKE